MSLQNGTHPREQAPSRLARSPSGGAALVPGNPGNSGGKKGRSGRKPDWLKQQMAQGREKAVEQILALLETNSLDIDQLLRLVKEWAPTPDQVPPGARELRVRWVNEASTLKEVGGGTKMV